MTTPAHKQTNPDMLPGQIVTPVKEQFHRPSYLPVRNPENMPKTLGDVVKQMEESEQKLLKKKLSFEEWFRDNLYDENIGVVENGIKRHSAKMAWNAAQENM